MMPKVYVAGPLTGSGTREDNVRRALEVAGELLDRGFAPYVPHLTHYWDLIQPRPHETWLRLDIQWLISCDAMIRLEGVSPGADIEEAVARAVGIPIFRRTDCQLLLEWKEGWYGKVRKGDDPGALRRTEGSDRRPGTRVPRRRVSKQQATARRDHARDPG